MQSIVELNIRGVDKIIKIRYTSPLHYKKVKENIKLIKNYIFFQFSLPAFKKLFFSFLRVENEATFKKSSGKSLNRRNK